MPQSHPLSAINWPLSIWEKTISSNSSSILQEMYKSHLTSFRELPKLTSYILEKVTFVSTLREFKKSSSTLTEFHKLTFNFRKSWRRCDFIRSHLFQSFRKNSFHSPTLAIGTILQQFFHKFISFGHFERIPCTHVFSYCNTILPMLTFFSQFEGMLLYHLCEGLILLTDNSLIQWGCGGVMWLRREFEAVRTEHTVTCWQWARRDWLRGSVIQGQHGRGQALGIQKSKQPV